MVNQKTKERRTRSKRSQNPNIVGDLSLLESPRHYIGIMASLVISTRSARRRRTRSTMIQILTNPPKMMEKCLLLP